MLWTYSFHALHLSPTAIDTSVTRESVLAISATMFSVSSEHPFASTTIWLVEDESRFDVIDRMDRRMCLASLCANIATLIIFRCLPGFGVMAPTERFSCLDAPSAQFCIKVRVIIDYDGHVGQVAVAVFICMPNNCRLMQPRSGVDVDGVVLG